MLEPEVAAVFWFVLALLLLPVFEFELVFELEPDELGLVAAAPLVTRVMDEVPAEASVDEVAWLLEADEVVAEL